MADTFWFTEAQMARLRPLFAKSYLKPRVDDRRALSGTIFINHGDLRWCGAPAEYALQPLEAVERRGRVIRMLMELA